MIVSISKIVLSLSTIFFLLPSLTQALAAVSPVQQVVVYEAQSAQYTNFHAAIFAQGQMSEAVKLQAGSEIALYVDVFDLIGPIGLSNPSTRCTDTQKNASYYQNSIAMDKRFCPDFHDAILDKTVVYGQVPTEEVFLHTSSGARCFETGGGGAQYLINPASNFYRNYLVKRGTAKLIEYDTATFFLDDIQPGWNIILSRCGGVPQEYSNSTSYYTQMFGLAKYVHDNMPLYKIEANMANSDNWDKISFLDGAMCESCFSDWGGSWPSASQMLVDLTVLDEWVSTGHKAYVVNWPPNTTAASNRFTFAAALLVARDTLVYHHFGSDYSTFYPIPEYTYDIGLPIGAYTCISNICSRTFERANVEVDFANHTGQITLTTNSVSGDANGDGIVDGRDYSIWVSKYGQLLLGATHGDFNNTGLVDVVDFGIWITQYSKGRQL